VKFPTGGDGDLIAQARERLVSRETKVSRFGSTPKPTVTVRMKESAWFMLPARWVWGAAAWARARP
jgi:hypothetical protein